MTIFFEIGAVVLGLVGLIGCILPILPGPPLSYGGVALLYFFANETVNGEPEITGRFMLIWLAVTIVVTILDYIVPAWFTKVTGGSKGAVRGSIGGMLIGILFFPPIGILMGAFVGALLGEMLLSGRKFSDSLLPAFGSFFGFIFGTGIKLATSGILFFYIIKFL